MTRRYDAVCEAGHTCSTTDADALLDWMGQHNQCWPPHRCKDCGRWVLALVADADVCVKCDGALAMVA